MTLGQDYELIFVNDGSTDNSYQVLTYSCSKLNRGGYLLINQPNSGVSSARNVGLKHAKGDYIWFVDSDDIVATESLEWANTEIRKNPLVKIIRYYHLRVPENVDRETLLKKQYTPNVPQSTTAFSYIVKRKHLQDNGITFNESMSYGEDTLWTFEVNFLAGEENVCDGGRVNYFYRVREGSAMQTRNAKTKLKHLSSMETMLDVYERILREKENILTPVQKCNLRKRIDWSVQNVLFDSLLILPNDEQRNVFERVAYKQNALNWDKLSVHHGSKNLLINLIGLPLKYRIYFNLMGWAFSKFKK